jgi:GntR family transcriptional repressor for pyruvate dehydrogenase complex
MAFSRVEREDLTSSVARQIRTSILSGAYSPGDFLPAERSLAMEFGVDRNTLRSAVQELEQLGLVQRRQGSGCRVLDYRETATLDLLQYLVFTPGTDEVDAAVVRSAIDISAMTFRGIIALVAERAKPEDFVAIQQALDGLRAAIAADDAHGAYDAVVAVTRQIVRAAHSPAAELVLNTYLQVANAAFGLDGTLEFQVGRQIIDQGHLTQYEGAVAALEGGDAEAAQHLGDAILAPLGQTLTDAANTRGTAARKRTA